MLGLILRSRSVAEKMKMILCKGERCFAPAGCTSSQKIWSREAEPLNLKGIWSVVLKLKKWLRYKHKKLQNRNLPRLNNVNLFRNCEGFFLWRRFYVIDLCVMKKELPLDKIELMISDIPWSNRKLCQK